MFNADHLIDLLIMGWLSNVPLAIGSVLTLGVFFDRIRAFRGLEVGSRKLATRVIDALVGRDLAGAQALCEKSRLPVGGMMLEALRWQNIALEDYDRILATLRAGRHTDPDLVVCLIAPDPERGWQPAGDREIAIWRAGLAPLASPRLRVVTLLRSDRG